MDSVKQRKRKKAKGEQVGKIREERENVGGITKNRQGRDPEDGADQVKRAVMSNRQWEWVRQESKGRRKKVG